MTNPLYKKHVISIKDLTLEEIELVLDVAKGLKQTPNKTLLQDKLVASCFFEPSTRT